MVLHRLAERIVAMLFDQCWNVQPYQRLMKLKYPNLGLDFRFSTVYERLNKSDGLANYVSTVWPGGAEPRTEWCLPRS